jgi:Rrf2 family protein
VLITRETDYALRILRLLAPGGKVTAETVCQKEFLPKQFAYKILRKLQKAGLVEAIRGADGGFRLTVDLEEVNLYDLMGVTEDKRLISACMNPNFECARRRNNSACSVHQHLLRLQAELDERLRALTLRRLLTEGEEA